MCRTVHALLQTLICGIQMLVRVFMTIILMIENLIRMILQTLYNFISFLLQMLSLIPICIVFLLTARLKCFMCGGGGPCPVNRGGACDCIMSALAIVILFFIFRATGVLDKIFYSIGYSKARIPVYKFVPTPGIITECSRNDTDYEEISSTLNETEEMRIFYTSTIDLIEYTSTTPFDTNNLDDIDKFVVIYTTTTEAQTESDVSSPGDGTSTTPKPQNNGTSTTTTSRTTTSTSSATTTTSPATTTTKRTTTTTITTTTKPKE